MEYCGLGSSHTWESIGQYINDQTKLRSHHDNIDVWVGSLLEEKVEGGLEGPTTQCLLVEQFKRLRDGVGFGMKIINISMENTI